MSGGSVQANDRRDALRLRGLGERRPVTIPTLGRLSVTTHWRQRRPDWPRVTADEIETGPRLVRAARVALIVWAP
jgi:hypothetical protein